MNGPGQKDKFTPELRILVASLLSFGVIILWAKANRPARATQSPGANCSGNSWDGNITGGDSIPDSRGAKNRASANGEYRGQERFARTQHRRRECSLPRRDFKPRRGSEELAAQELQG